MFRISLLIAITALSYLPLFAQLGYGNAAMGVGTTHARRGEVPPLSSVVEEEYFNYHDHRLPSPYDNQNVRIDLQWARIPGKYADAGNLLLQVGLTTRREATRETRPPANLCLLVDKSGSMSGGKMSQTQNALTALSEQLLPTDRVSLIAFDQGVATLMPSQLVGNGQALRRNIALLSAGGGTNLEVGVIAGYRELIQNFEPNSTNRLLILTDALLNTGELDPRKILRQAQLFDEMRHVDFTLIGLGADFNVDAARGLAGQTGYSVHFVGDPHDLKKVFVDEVEALLWSIGRSPRLAIEIPDAYEIVNAYGYRSNSSQHGGTYTYTLNELNAGLTQVFLFRLRNRSGHIPPQSPPLVRAILSYRSPNAGASTTHREVVNLVQHPPNASSSLRKNLAIAELARGIRDMVTRYYAGDRSAARASAGAALRIADKIYPGSDADVDRVRGILRGHHDNITVIEETEAESKGPDARGFRPN